MKLHWDMPWGGCLDYHREPMTQGRFELLCWLAGVGMAFLFFSHLLRP